MKQTLTTMVLITLLFSGLVLGETMGDLVKLDGLYYKEFTGKITGKEQGIIKNGKREGPWIYYYDNGQVMCKGTWKDGKHQGPWVYYWDNGQVFSKGTYKDGKREGLWIGKYPNGYLMSKRTYKDGKQEDTWIHYQRDGSVKRRDTGDDIRVVPAGIWDVVDRLE